MLISVLGYLIRLNNRYFVILHWCDCSIFSAQLIHNLQDDGRTDILIYV